MVDRDVNHHQKRMGSQHVCKRLQSLAHRNLDKKLGRKVGDVSRVAGLKILAKSTPPSILLCLAHAFARLLQATNPLRVLPVPLKAHGWSLTPALSHLPVQDRQSQ